MKRLALITTVYRHESHADVIMARWLESIAEDRRWGWTGPRSRVVSAHVAQIPDNDLSADRLSRAGIPRHPTIAAALRCGGSRVAVDGVLFVAEHGDYPFNRLGQHLYPRAEMFHEVLNTLEADGVAIPVFFDKHLSWDYDVGLLMQRRAQALGVEVWSASSLPLCRYRPDLSCAGEAVDEAVAVFPLVGGGNAESYGYHSLEVAQQKLEVRANARRGVVDVCAWRGADVWRAAETEDWPIGLYHAAWAMSDPTKTPRDTPVDAEWERCEADEPTQAFRITYADGLRVTHLGIEKSGAFALAWKGPAGTRACGIDAGRGSDDRHSNFAALARAIEDWMFDGAEPFPPTRALLSCGTLQAMCQAAALAPGTSLPTPHLTDLDYAPPPRPVGVDHWGCGP